MADWQNIYNKTWPLKHYGGFVSPSTDEALTFPVYGIPGFGVEKQVPEYPDVFGYPNDWRNQGTPYFYTKVAETGYTFPEGVIIEGRETVTITLAGQLRKYDPHYTDYYTPGGRFIESVRHFQFTEPDLSWLPAGASLNLRIVFAQVTNIFPRGAQTWGAFGYDIPLGDAQAFTHTHVFNSPPDVSEFFQRFEPLFSPAYPGVNPFSVALQVILADGTRKQIPNETSAYSETGRLCFRYDALSISFGRDVKIDDGNAPGGNSAALRQVWNLQDPFGRFHKTGVSGGKIVYYRSDFAVPGGGHPYAVAGATVGPGRYPRMAWLPSGVLVHSCEVDTGAKLRYSDDGGRTWGREIMAIDGGTKPTVSVGTDGTLVAAALIGDAATSDNPSPSTATIKARVQHTGDIELGEAFTLQYWDSATSSLKPIKVDKNETFHLSHGHEGPNRWVLTTVPAAVPAGQTPLPPDFYSTELKTWTPIS